MRQLSGKSMVLMKRILVYALGLLFMAFGVACSVNSNLGVSPVNSLPYVVSLVSGVDMGNCVIGVFGIYILVQILLLRRNFKLINLMQLLFSTLFGYFVDFAKWIVGDFAIPTYFGQLFLLLMSIILVALGVCLYLDAKLVNMPMEGMVHAVQETFFPKKAFHDIKVVMDCAVVLLAIALSFAGLGKLEGIREGTVICALVIGKMMKPMQKRLVPMVEQFCSEKGGNVQ